ncbi:F-box/kelch-repeat protein At3g23880-like [Rutidosis leptorrhynchoides]|uniref:F-box/kelch-repeat protein At3g23880-like n=1 Tax=Rutidosis leptorrhynchoides TaxID=125765 RepID=UPI003A99F20C
MSHLPDDILVNILSRLPAKSLGQFKSVCKCWFSLISSENFVNLHQHHAICDIHTNHSRVFIMSNNSMHSVNYESPSCYEGVDDDAESIVSLNNPLTKEAVGEKLLGSCYSLIFFVCFDECILLWNPTTQKTRLIPDPIMTDGTPFYGLGYDFSTNDYKMVRASCSISSKSISFGVFNLKTGYWKMGQATHIDIEDNPDEIGIFSNRSLNWLVRHSAGFNKLEIILSFDMRDEIFTIFSLPDCGGFSCLGDMKGCLYAVSGGDGADADIWVMKEYGLESSWSKVIKLNFSEFYCDYEMWPVCFTLEDDVIIDLDSWTMVRYSLTNKTIKKFKKRTTDWHDWLVYHQTLVSP